MRQCLGPEALLVQMQPKLPLISAAGAHVRPGIEGLGSRNSLPTVSQHCVVSHNFFFSRDMAAYLWHVAQGL